WLRHMVIRFPDFPTPVGASVHRLGGDSRGGGHMTRKAKLPLALIAAVTGWAVPAWAQVQTGRIVGTVRDPQQATVGKATVTVTASATGEAQTVTANEHGDYVVTPVNPGRYDISVV